MPVASQEAPGTNKTIEVEPQWLEVVKERRAKNAAAQAKAAAPPPPPAAAAPARPKVRPIIPREDD